MCFYVLVAFNRYKEVFGPKLEHKTITLADQSGLFTVRWGSGSGIDEKLYGDEYNCTSLQVCFSPFIS